LDEVDEASERSRFKRLSTQPLDDVCDREEGHTVREREQWQPRSAAAGSDEAFRWVLVDVAQSEAKGCSPS